MSIPSRVRIGGAVSEFPGNSWNAIVDAYWVNRDRAPRRQGTGESRGSGGMSTVLAQNTTGATVDFGGVLAIDGIATSFANNNNIRHQVPLATGIAYEPGKQWGIIQGRVIDDGITPLAILGHAWCKINILDAGHNFAEPIEADVDKLQSASSGAAPIIWKETGTGTKWCIVQLGSIGLQRVLITSTISAASWNNTTDKLTPVSFTAKLLTPNTDGTLTYNTTAGSGEVTADSFYSTAITITTGNARFGYVQNGELVIVDCTEITL